MRITQKRIREQALKERGLSSFKPKHKHRRLQATPIKTVSQYLKTPMMKWLESIYGKPIEEILLSGSLSYVAKQLGNEVDSSTVSKWIKRLKLRYTKDNLPECDGCVRKGPSCDGNICTVLMELKKYDLMLLKRKELLNVGGT